MAHTSVLQGRINAKLNNEPTVHDSILSDSKNVIRSSDPGKFNGSHSTQNNNASGLRKRKRRKNRGWSHRRLKRPKTSREITRAVYPVSYEYTLEYFTKNKGTGKHPIAIAPTASEITLNDSRKVISAGNLAEPKDSKYNNTVPSPRMQESLKNQLTTKARCARRANFLKQDDNAVSNDYDCWTQDHTYCVPSYYSVHSSSPTSCSLLTTDDETSSVENPSTIAVHPTCREERAKSIPCVDLHLLVVDPSPACVKDASVVSDNFPGRDYAQIDNHVDTDSDAEIDRDHRAQVDSEILSDLIDESASGTPFFWDELEASVRLKLPLPWMTRTNSGQLSLMRIPVRYNLAVQIGITFDASDTRFFVHHKPLSSAHEMQTHRPRIGTLTLREAVETVLKTVSTVDRLKVCRGARDYEEFWNMIADGYIEEDLFSENESSCKVLRSQKCKLLIRRTSACVECKKIADRLRRFKLHSMNRLSSQDPLFRIAYKRSNHSAVY